MQWLHTSENEKGEDSREAKNINLLYDQSQLASHGEEEMHRRMEPPRRLFPLLIGSAFIVAMAALLLLRFSSIRKPEQPRMWTVEEIAPFNGTDDKVSILLGILGCL